MERRQRHSWFHHARRHPLTRTTGRALLHTSLVTRRLLGLGIGVVVLASLVLIFGAWRLSDRPLESTWLTNQVRAALVDQAGPLRVSFATVSLAWDGYRNGVDYPLDLKVSGLDVTDLEGHRLLTAEEARMRFGFADLLLGRIFPRSVEIDRAQVNLTRETAGLIEGTGTPAAEPPSFPGSRKTNRLGIPNHVVRVHVRDSGIVFRDSASGLEARGDNLDLDLMRVRGGHIHGTLRAPVTVANQATTVTADLDLVPGGDSTVVARFTPLRPSALAAPPELAFLKGLDVPVTLEGAVTLGPDFQPRRMQLQGWFGSGDIHFGQGSSPLLAGSVALAGTPDRLTVSRLRLDLARAADGLPETIELSGTVNRISDRIGASLTVTLNHLDAADLPRFWPEGVGGGTRTWIVEHVLGGLATHGTVAATIETDKDFRDVTLVRAGGDLDVSNASFTWIDRVPPVEQADVHLRLVDPDTLDITVPLGRQRIGGRNADLLVKDGRMRITGLSARDQAADIQLNVEGPVTSALALLSEPRLKLLSVHPIGLKPITGDAVAALGFRFPLRDKLQIDDVDIRANAKLSEVRIPNVIGRNGIDTGAFDLGIDKDGLTVKGRAALAAIPVSLTGAMDFRDGTPDQTVQKINVTGQAEATQLAAAGLPVTDLMAGPIPLTAVMTEKRNGEATVAMTGDLTGATMGFAPLGWHKPAGVSANASALLKLSHDRLVAIDRIAMRGDGLQVLGSSVFADNHPRSLTLDSVQLGRTQAHGMVQVAPNGAVTVALQGSAVDLADKLAETTPPEGAEPSITPAWSLDGHFDRALLANGEVARDVIVKAAGAGEKIRTLDALGSTNGDGRFSILITPEGEKRRLAIRAADAGRFLRGLDTISGLQSGRLTINGVLDSALGFSPMSGTARVDQVVVRNSPVLGKLLQAVTVYGLVDALRGPGMAFTRVAVPFRYDGRDLYLDNAVAENASLGLTAQGRIGLARTPAGPTPSSVNGTIVPAYFFNALPGHLPLVGKLFSPEKGGGVFAARFSLDGPISDPTITINAASALTPGFLRGLFGIFDKRPEMSGR